MFGVKISIVMFVVTLFWIFIFVARCRSLDPLELLAYKVNKNWPFWYWGLGLMILADWLAVIYDVIYFLFFHVWGL